MRTLRFYLLLLLCGFSPFLSLQAADTTLVLKTVIRGKLSPKSVVHNGKGLFFAQNMMYNHSITVYDSDYKLVNTIPDKVDLSRYGFKEYSGSYRGAPVECAFSHDGQYAWVSNYQMEGEGFTNPGCDDCSGNTYDESFVYKINTRTFAIEKVIRTGSVPKYLAVSPDDRYLLVSNWSSANLSIIDLHTEKEIKRVPAGRFPRGIAIDSRSRYAYIALMGDSRILRLDLHDFTVSSLLSVGRAPRHLCLDTRDSLLYVSLNQENKLAQVNLHTLEIRKIEAGGTPRSMVLSNDNQFLYTVNYHSGTVSKIRLPEFRLVETVKTSSRPIGITFAAHSGEIWVACYSGDLMVFEDNYYRERFFAGSIRILQQKFQEMADVWSRHLSLWEKTLTLSGQGYTEPRVQKPVEEQNIFTEKTEIPSASDRFYVVTGSFRERQNAEKQAQDLSKKGYKSEVIENQNSSFYYAVAGAFTHKEEALSLSAALKTLYSDNWVWEKK